MRSRSGARTRARSIPRARVPVGLGLALLFLLLLLPLAPLPGAVAQAPSAGSNEVRLSALQYHPYPDFEGDPFGFPSPLVANASRDWMAHYYDGFWFPTTAFDGLDVAYNLPTNQLKSFYERYRERFESRLAQDAAATLSIMGRANATGGSFQVHVDPRADINGGRVVLRVTLFEDDIPFEGANGVDVHRFVARHQFAERDIELRRGEGLGPYNYTFEIPRLASGTPAWAPGRLGVVAHLQVDAPPVTPALKEREVLQSATYSFRQTGPTIQVQKAVLVEMYTATWCEACVYGDGALDLLAEEFGVASTLKSDTRFRYLRDAPALLPLLVAAPAFALAAWILVPRGRTRK